jgi:endonuclease/exonuclease/phosphatase family metal-dependent hydrolase
MTANIAGHPWMGWSQRAALCGEVLAACPCSIVGFQEFGADSQPALAPIRPDLDFVLGEPANEVYLNAIAFERARFTSVESGTFWLSRDGTCKRDWDAEEVRAASWVRLRDRFNDTEILFVNTHLDHVGATARSEGMRQILTFIDSRGRQMATDRDAIPTIITADLNAGGTAYPTESPRPGSDALGAPYEMVLERGFVDAWRETHPARTTRPPTFHGFQGPDYGGNGTSACDVDAVFVRGMECVNAVVVRDGKGGVFPSDHYFLMALLSS